MKRFSLQALHEKYGLRREVASALVRSGWVQPVRGTRREYLFSFHDVVLLRMAQDLQRTGLSPHRLAKSLRELSDSLPDAAAAGTRILAAGRELVVRQDGRLRNLRGQLVLDFSADERAAQLGPGGQASLHEMARGARPAPRPAAASDELASPSATLATDSSQADAARSEAVRLYLRAGRGAVRDAASAVDDYRRALTLDPGMEEAWIDLSCLLLETGSVAEAASTCREGLSLHAHSALLHYNLAIAHEESEHLRSALEHYRAALRIAPDLVDAHWNAAQVCERLGEERAAIRHYSAWRKRQAKE